MLFDILTHSAFKMKVYLFIHKLKNELWKVGLSLLIFVETVNCILYILDKLLFSLWMCASFCLVLFVCVQPVQVGP